MVPRIRFGNVRDQDVLDIWDSPTYRAFRRSSAHRVMYGTTRAVAAVTGGGEASARRLPPPPDPCRTCPKLYGV